MAKHIVEKLRAEIVRRRNKWLEKSRLIKKGRDVAMYAAGKSSAYSEFLSYLDSLQQEQPVLPDNIDKAAKEYDETESWRYEALPYPRRAAFIEGAKWMARQMKQEQPEVDIEKEIVEHAENMPHGEFIHESECIEHEKWARAEFRHFYERGLNARKEDEK